MSQNDNPIRESNSAPAANSVALEGITRIEQEQGRWVVWLNVPFWDEAATEENPVENHWHRISDYGRESDALVAARMIECSVNRPSRPLTGF